MDTVLICLVLVSPLLYFGWEKWLDHKERMKEFDHEDKDN